MTESIISQIQKLEDDVWDVIAKRTVYDQSLHAVYERLRQIRENAQAESQTSGE